MTTLHHGMNSVRGYHGSVSLATDDAKFGNFMLFCMYYVVGLVSSVCHWWHSHKTYLLPRDAKQRAVMPQYVVRLSVRPSVTFRYRDHMGRLEWFENYFTAE